MRVFKSRYGHVRFRLMDIIFIVYVGLVGILILFFHERIRLWPLLAALHFLILAGALEIIRLGEKHREKKILWFMRTTYSLFLMLFCWRELSLTVLMLFDSFWGTDLLIRTDLGLFRGHPTLWAAQFERPWIDELMSFFYTAYFSFFFLIPGYFFLRKKYEETLAVISQITLIYYGNFILFYLIPAVGPHHSSVLAQSGDHQSGGFLFAALNAVLQGSAGVRGAAFPSSHVAGALGWVLAAGRYSRRLGWALAPVALGVGLATVYLGYHHAVDPMAGYVWGAAGFIIGLRWLKKRGEDPRSLKIIMNAASNKSLRRTK
jgi:membrane-associated phospholipid phosphatase